MFDTYQEIFAARAGSYQHAMEMLPRARDHEFLTMIEPLTEIIGRTICDMPSGGGYLHRYLPAGAHYVAVEPSETFVANCPTGPGCAAVQAPIEQVPLKDGSVDYILSLAGLHHSPDLGAVFREMRRLVRNDGMVVIADVEQSTAPAEFLNGYVNDHNSLGHRGTFLNEATSLLLRDAGLEPVADTLIEIPWGFENFRQAGAYCGALFGIGGVSPDDIAGAMEATLGVCDGPGSYNVRWELRRLICMPI